MPLDPVSLACTCMHTNTSTPHVTPLLKLQNGSAHVVGASYSGLYEEGEVEHINCQHFSSCQS